MHIRVIDDDLAVDANADAVVRLGRQEPAARLVEIDEAADAGADHIGVVAGQDRAGAAPIVQLRQWRTGLAVARFLHLVHMAGLHLHVVHGESRLQRSRGRLGIGWFQIVKAGQRRARPQQHPGGNRTAYIPQHCLHPDVL